LALAVTDGDIVQPAAGDAPDDFALILPFRFERGIL